MGYYHICLSEHDSNLYTTILPWEKYRYKCLPMGVSNSPEILQEKMNEIICGFEFIQAYIDKLLVITKGDWSDHLEKLELTLQKLKDSGLRWNINKSPLGKNEMWYLGFWVTRIVIRPINNKVEAIVNMTPPKNTREVRVFVGIVKHYRYMWSTRLHLLHTLNALMSPKVKFKWTDMEHKEFDYIKRAVTQDTLLTYPDFNKKIDIHTDARE